jgi:hypothetical protein
MLDSWHRALFVVVIVLPFLAQGVPYPGGIPLFLPFAALLLPATVLLRVANKGISGVVVGDGIFMFICVALIMSYAYGILLSTDFPGIMLLREMVTGVVAMTVVFTVANSDWDKATRDRLVEVIAWLFLAVGVFVGALGAMKLIVFVMRGELLEFVSAASSGPYPWGTSLVSDYNFYALTILTAILAGLFLCKDRGPAAQIVLAIVIAGLIVVGFLAGSRRFWVVAPVFIVFQAAWAVARGGFRTYLPVICTLLVLGLAGPLALAAGAGQDFGELLTSGWNIQYRLSTLLDAGSGFGLRDRFELWYAAADRLTGTTPWAGSGFDYMRWFSCEFGNCSGDGYPHMPILSAYLYGGMLVGIVVILMYVYMTVAGIRLMSYGYVMSWLIFPLMAAFLFAAISANGAFSIRSHVLLGALCVGLLHAEKADLAASSASNPTAR